MRIGRLRGVGGHEQRVAIGRRARDELRRDAAECAGAAVDDDRLARLLGDLGTHCAGQSIRGAAGAGTDHDGDRLGRIGLRAGHARRQHGHGDCRQKSDLHLVSCDSDSYRRGGAARPCNEAV